jgi:hypothetical protein
MSRLKRGRDEPSGVVDGSIRSKCSSRFQTDLRFALPTVELLERSERLEQLSYPNTPFASSIASISPTPT